MTRARVYWRNGRAWGDFRDYAPQGGAREPLVAPGERRATTDPDVARVLLAARLTQLDEARRAGRVLGARAPTLGAYATAHLVAKAESGHVTAGWLEASQLRLERACEFFGAARELTAIRPGDVRRWLEWLRRRPARSGDGALSPQTLRHHLNALSNLYARAQSEEQVPLGFNPAGALLEKPTPATQEAHWLEVHEAALLLEAVRRFESARPDRAFPQLYELVAAYLLTGGRKAEVLGLETADVSFDRQLVHIRPNRYRRLKTRGSVRVVPLWPQLEARLRPLVFGQDRPPATRLFAARRAGGEHAVGDFRKALRAALAAVPYDFGHVTPKVFRHTYIAARLQTLDGGEAVSKWTVQREVGHTGAAMIDRIYGHLGAVRHRAAVVEYRIEHHAERFPPTVRGWLLSGPGLPGVDSPVALGTNPGTNQEASPPNLLSRP